METYDVGKIGKRIAWGRSHAVYRYGTDEVIKFPRLEKLLGGRIAERLERDMSICREYFGEYFLDTRLVQSADGTRTVAIQPYVAGRYFSKPDLADEVVKQEFENLMQCYDALIDNGFAPIDLIGQGGVLRRCLSNVYVLDDKRLKIFDASILDTEGFERWIFAARLIIRFAQARQKSTLRYLRS